MFIKLWWECAFLDLEDIFSKEMILLNEPIKNYVSFKIGGNADYMVFPNNYEQIATVIKYCFKSKIRFYVLGNGSNLLVSDKGFNGIIINTTSLKQIELLDDNIISSQCGISLAALSKFALNNELSGVEFASGIPGTLGGAIFMNAGAYGGEMKDVVISASVLDLDDFKIKTLTSEQLKFAYRDSIIQSKPYIVLDVKLKLVKSNYDSVRNLMAELNLKRKEKQPLEYPSCGSTFKRPDGYFAAKLIMDSGLKGRSVGGAKVSEKHSGFIINYDNATFDDVKSLIKLVEEEVYNNFQVKLVPEIRIIE